MCTGKCSRCIAVTLYPLAAISIICNIVLFFPNADTTYAKNGHITEEVKYMGGLVGGGVLVSCLFSCLVLTGATLAVMKTFSHANVTVKNNIFIWYTGSLT